MTAADALRSDARFVLIEAPGGCGKTHMACEYAREASVKFTTGKRVLVLAHTNAAVEELVRRTADLRNAVRVTTFDSLALQLVSPYAEALGLPVPIRPGEGPGRVQYSELSARAADLLNRCPIIARILSAAYPIVILDEHQDASRNQHMMAMSLRGEGSLIRAFGDPMQAIFGEDRPTWEELIAGADIRVELTTPHRWHEDPALGAWILQSREALKQGRKLPTETAPPSVRVLTIRGTDVGYGAGNPREYSSAISSVPQQRAALLTARIVNVDTLRQASGNRASVYEGSVLQHLYEAFDKLIENVGSPRQLAQTVLALLTQTCTGLTAVYRRRIEQSLEDHRLNLGRQHTVMPLLVQLQILYEHPSIDGVAQLARGVLAECPAFLTFHRPAAFCILSAITSSGADPYDQLQESMVNYKSVTRRPNFAVGTVQRIKGLEYDHVLVFNVSKTHFKDDDYGRKLLYIAISRCRTSLTILVPETGRSPLIP